MPSGGYHPKLSTVSALSDPAVTGLQCDLNESYFKFPPHAMRANYTIFLSDLMGVFRNDDEAQMKLEMANTSIFKKDYANFSRIMKVFYKEKKKK